jgi:hypothetical protein
MKKFLFFLACFLTISVASQAQNLEYEAISIWRVPLDSDSHLIQNMITVFPHPLLLVHS